jgi:bacteriocin biosynthesis cyclodehydratase domain-containing protein
MTQTFSDARFGRRCRAASYVRPRRSNPPMGRTYAPSREWRLIYDRGLVVLSAGADRLYALEDVTEAAAAELISCWEHEEFDDGQLSVDGRNLLDRLAECRVLEARPTGPVGRIAVRWAGTREVALENRLADLFEENDRLVLLRDNADLVLVIRTTARLVDLYPGGERDAAPHLLLDLAYNHTVSVGPLVLAGETACLACLAGRINHFWGDPQPPVRPAILRAAPLAAALAVHELEGIVYGDYSLAGATFAYDLESRRTVAGAVYRLPWCPVCGDGGESAGIAELPWASAA